MLIEILLLALSLSTDAISIGFTYQTRNVKIPLPSKLLMCLITFTTAIISMIIGQFVSSLIPTECAKYIGSIGLFLLGIYFLLQIFFEGKDKNNCHKNPVKEISFSESFYVGLIMSLDSMCAGLSYSISGCNIFILPIVVGITQFICLNFGVFISKKIPARFLPNKKAVNIICGVSIIGIATLKCI